MRPRPFFAPSFGFLNLCIALGLFSPYSAHSLCQSCPSPWQCLGVGTRLSLGTCNLPSLCVCRDGWLVLVWGRGVLTVAPKSPSDNIKSHYLCPNHEKGTNQGNIAIWGHPDTNLRPKQVMCTRGYRTQNIGFTQTSMRSASKFGHWTAKRDRTLSNQPSEAVKRKVVPLRGWADGVTDGSRWSVGTFLVVHAQCHTGTLYLDSILRISSATLSHESALWCYIDTLYSTQNCDRCGLICHSIPRPDIEA